MVVVVSRTKGSALLDDVIACLACPLCAAAFRRRGGSLRCENGHAFDIARQGYASLLPGDAHTGTADTAEMVSARETFLAAGHYDAVMRLVADAAASAPAKAAGGCVLDVGAGTGYYLAAVLERLPDASGVALDLSKQAARRAVRAHPRIGAVVADTWSALPIRDGAAAVVLDVFAPRNASEFRRVLAPEGLLVVVTPTERHLREIVEPMGLLTVDERKAQRVDEQLGGLFECVGETPIEVQVELTHADLRSLAGMGPSARHVSPEETRRRVEALPEPLAVTVSVVVARYR